MVICLMVIKSLKRTVIQMNLFSVPLGRNGFVLLNDAPIGIEQIQIEQDTAKAIALSDDKNTTRYDYNRAGVGLIEIVSKPEIYSSELAALYARKICSILKQGGICDGKLEDGSLRCDVNVSLQSLDGSIKGERCEIKNLNSFKSISASIEYEIERQKSILNAGAEVKRETLGFNKHGTFALRDKDSSPQYRYYPEYNLNPIIIPESEIERIRHELKESFIDWGEELKKSFNLSDFQVEKLKSHDGSLKFFHDIMQEIKKDHSQFVVEWITSDLFGCLHKHSKTIEDILDDQRWIEIILYMIDKKISSFIGF